MLTHTKVSFIFSLYTRIGRRPRLGVKTRLWILAVGGNAATTKFDGDRIARPLSKGLYRNSVGTALHRNFGNLDERAASSVFHSPTHPWTSPPLFPICKKAWIFECRNGDTRVLFLTLFGSISPDNRTERWFKTNVSFFDPIFSNAL
jgi:hypothetical protein